MESFIAEAEEQLKKLPYEDIGRRQDRHHRSLEAGSGSDLQRRKTVNRWEIYRSFMSGGNDGYESQPGSASRAESVIPEIEYDETASTLGLYFNRPRQTGVRRCTGGTSIFRWLRRRRRRRSISGAA